MLSNYCRTIREQGLTAGDVKDPSSTNTQLILSAIFFDDVASGGFAKWVYNANGVYLPETVDVLTAIGADSTNGYVDRVLNHCVNYHDDYQSFLAGEFEDSPFKEALNALTDEYLASELPIEIEAEEPLKKLLEKTDA